MKFILKVHSCQRCNYRLVWLYEISQSFRKIIRAAYFWFVINNIPIKQAELFQNILSKIHKKKDSFFKSKYGFGILFKK